MSSKRVLIVGGVAGGASCAARLRRLDERAEIFIFERSGDVSFANCGLPYYIGGAIADRRRLLVSTPERFRDFFQVEVRTWHEVRGIDRRSRTIEVQNLQTGATGCEPYDALVLSTGAAPVRPPLPGIDLPGIFTLRDLHNVDQIHAWVERRKANRAVVVGGGYIGLEMVENLSRRGIAVTLLEMTGQVMPPMDPEMVVPVQRELERQGIELKLETAVAAFEPGPNETITVVAQHEERISADLVILAVGIKPDTQLARAAGLEIGPTGGIRVDEQMRTSDPAVFAVGDAVEVRDFVTGLPALIPLAGPANRQGRIAADVISGRNARYRGSQGTAVVGVFDLTLAMTGAAEKSLRRAGIPFEKSYTHAFHHAAYYPGAERIHSEIALRAGVGPAAWGAGRWSSRRGKADRRDCDGHSKGGHGVRPRGGGTVLRSAVRRGQRPGEHGRLRGGQRAPRRRQRRPLAGVEGAAGGRPGAADAGCPHADGRRRRSDPRHDPHPLGRASRPARRAPPRPGNLGPLRRRADLLLRRPAA